MNMTEGDRGRDLFQWPSLSNTKEEEMLTAIRLFAKALSYEIAPLLESVRSNAELLKGAIEEGAFVGKKALETPGARIDPYHRLYYIAQQAVTARQILEKAQCLSALRTTTIHGMEMLDLTEALTSSRSSRRGDSEADCPSPP